MNKLFLQWNDTFIHYVFKKEEFYKFLEDDNIKLSDLEVIEEWVSNMTEIWFRSDDTFIIWNTDNKDEKYSINRLSYDLEDIEYDHFNWMLVWYSKKLDITITIEHIEELHIFKWDPLNIVNYYNSRLKKN